jgi:hypothetical protein
MPSSTHQIVFFQLALKKRALVPLTCALGILVDATWVKVAARRVARILVANALSRGPAVAKRMGLVEFVLVSRLQSSAVNLRSKDWSRSRLDMITKLNMQQVSL